MKYSIMSYLKKNRLWIVVYWIPKIQYSIDNLVQFYDVRDTINVFYWDFMWKNQHKSVHN